MDSRKFEASFSLVPEGRRFAALVSCAIFFCLLSFGLPFNSDSLLSSSRVSFSQIFLPKAFAEKKSEKKTAARRKTRKRKEAPSKDNKKTGKKGEEKEAANNVPTLGLESGFGHEEFDKELQKPGGMDAVLIMDASRSMQRTDPNRLRIQGAKLFVRFLSEGDRLALIQFAENTNIVIPLTAITPTSLPDIDKAIESVPDEGNFTDLWSPIVAAMEMLGTEARPGAKKCVVLLSDGKMDPDPKLGNAEQLIVRLKENDLPLYEKNEIALYTLSLSEFADKKLLAELAALADGVHWYAPSVDSIHKIFSDLFLTLKMPQVVALDGSSFEVDGTATEATFFVSRKVPQAKVTIVNPRGQRFTNVDFPSGVKWYRGDLFDVVTIRNPLPGPWAVQGVDEPEGFATLLTDLKLQVRWPESHIRVGDSMAFMARLTEGSQVVETPGMDAVVFYTFKIVNSETGQLILQGALNDKGDDGDQKAGDDIYTHTIKIDAEGEYKAFITATGPTFTRQQHISFNVSKGMISLVREPANEFTGEPEGIRIIVGSRALELKKLQIDLIAKKKGESKALAIRANKYLRKDGVYDAPVNQLPKGDYELTAQLKGTDSKKKPVTAVSETLDYVSDGALVEEASDEAEELEIEELEEVDPTAVERFWGLIGTAISLLVCGTLGFVVHKRSDREGGIKVEERVPYTLPEDLIRKLDSARERASQTVKRTPTDVELEIFSLVAEVFGNISADEVSAAKHKKAAKTEEDKGEESDDASDGDENESEEGAAEEDEEGGGEEEESEDEPEEDSIEDEEDVSFDDEDKE